MGVSGGFVSVSMGSEPGRKATGDSTPQNTVRMDASRLERFLNARESEKGKNSASPRRDFVRWSFQAISVPLTVTYAGGTTATMHVACRDLSAGGIGILHSAYMHVGTVCSVALRTVHGQLRTIDGRVVRCVHVSGTIHEIGVKFDKPIETKDFVQLDPFANGFSLETVNPEKLHGTVLYLEDSPLDQSLVRHFLRQTQIELMVVETVEEAIKRVSDADLVLCDYHLKGENGADFVRQARDQGISQPILIVTADTSASTREQMVKANASAFVTKPVAQETLFRALAEFMMLNADVGGMVSSLNPGHPNEVLLEGFVEQIKHMATELAAAMAADDIGRARSICLQIAGSAPVMGFENLASMAKTAEKAISSTMSLQESAVALRTLISGCGRASGRRAA